MALPLPRLEIGNPADANVRCNADVTVFHVTLTSNVTIVRNVKKKCIYKLQFDTNFEISQIVMKLREIVIKFSSKNDEVDEKTDKSKRLRNYFVSEICAKSHQNVGDCFAKFLRLGLCKRMHIL